MADMDDAPVGGTPSGGGAVKKRATPAGKYKAMVKKASADTVQTPLMVEKADGSIGPWGNDIKPSKNYAGQTKPPLDMSDKAKGYSSNYYTPNK